MASFYGDNSKPGARLHRLADDPASRRFLERQRRQGPGLPGPERRIRGAVAPAPGALAYIVSFPRPRPKPENQP